VVFHQGRLEAIVATGVITFPFPVPRLISQDWKSDEEPVFDQEMVAAVPAFQTVVLIGAAGLIGFVLSADALAMNNAKVRRLYCIVRVESCFVSKVSAKGEGL